MRSGPQIFSRTEWEANPSLHPAARLWQRHHPPMGYPAGVIGVPQPIPGLAFFPGGYGLWGVVGRRNLPQWPEGGVMIVGHDFHSEAGYRSSLRAGGEPLTMPTWRNLIGVLADAGIPLERCFFTNAYMGLREGAVTTGPFPGAAEPTFASHCTAFLREQIRLQQPALILTLGVNVPPLLGTLSPELAPWTSGRGLRHLDAVGPVRSGVTVGGIDGYDTTVVALVHPSLRHASVRHRRYAGAVGAAAERAMVRDGMISAGLAPASPTVTP